MADGLASHDSVKAVLAAAAYTCAVTGETHPPDDLTKLIIVPLDPTAKVSAPDNFALVTTESARRYKLNNQDVNQRRPLPDLEGFRHKTEKARRHFLRNAQSM